MSGIFRFFSGTGRSIQLCVRISVPTMKARLLHYLITLGGSCLAAWALFLFTSSISKIRDAGLPGAREYRGHRSRVFRTDHPRCGP